MTTAGQPTGYFNTTYAVEFTVEGPLDGTTLQPPLLDSPPDPTGNTDPQQLYRRTVDALGLIDPDYTVPIDEDGRRGTRGNRLVTFLWIEGPAPGLLGASVDIVDAVDGTPIVQKNLGDLGGVDRFYRVGIFMPQGSMIRVGGMTGSAADPIKVRFHVQYLNNAEDIAAVLEAECCIEGVVPPPPIEGASCLTRFLVAPDAQCAPFQSIQDAYTAAKDAGHGFGEVKGPAQILVCPGEYTEDVTMDRAGIDIVAVSPNQVGENIAVLTGVLPPLGETRLLGQLTFDLDPVGGAIIPRSAWNGIDIAPATGLALAFTGSDPQVLKLSNCIVQSVDARGMLMDNTVGDSDEALVDARNVAFSSTSGAVPGSGVEVSGGPQTFRTWNTLIETVDGFGVNTIALRLEAGSIAVLDNTFVSNQTVVEDSALLAFDSFFSFDDGAAVTVNEDSLVQSLDCTFNGVGGGSFIAGSGFFVHDAVALPGDVDWSGGLSTFTIEGIPQEQFWKPVDLSVGDFGLSGQVNVLAAGDPAGLFTMRLPPALERAGPYRIIEDALTSPAPVTITAFGGDLIVVGTDAPAAVVTLPSPAAGNSGGFFLISDGGGLWYAITPGGAAAAGTPALDLTLDSFGAIQPPLVFTDILPLNAAQLSLPVVSSGLPVANRMWLGECDFGLFGGMTPGTYPMGNTDVRGGDPPFGTLKNQTNIFSGPDGFVVIEDTKRIADLNIDAGPPGNRGPFFFPGAFGTFLDNITTFGPENGGVGAPPFSAGFNSFVVDKCQFGLPGLESDGGFACELIVEDDNSFGQFSLQGVGGGGWVVEVRGTGNTFNELMAAGAGFLDIDIGHSSLLGSAPWSGAESINFGGGPLDMSVGAGTAPGTRFNLFPGGGDPGSSVPLVFGGADFPAEVGAKDGILRGIQLVAGGAVVSDFVDVEVYVGGVLAYTELGMFLTGGAGSFLSTTFGFMSAAFLPRSLAIVLRSPPVVGTTASFGYINVGFLIK